MRKFLAPLLKSKKINICQKVFYLIDLSFPPIVTLLLMLLIAMSVHLGPLFGEPWGETSGWLLPVHGFMVLTMAAYALSPIIVMKLPGRYLLSLFDLPVYIIWKLKLSSNHKPKEWVRTSREDRRQMIAGQDEPGNGLHEVVRRMARFYANLDLSIFKTQNFHKR